MLKWYAHALDFCCLCFLRWNLSFQVKFLDLFISTTLLSFSQPDRQVTMWSATWPKSIAKLARDYLTSPEGPVNIKIGSAELIANKGIDQKFEITPQRSKQMRYENDIILLVQLQQGRSCNIDTYAHFSGWVGLFFGKIFKLAYSNSTKLASILTSFRGFWGF